MKQFTIILLMMILFCSVSYTAEQQVQSKFIEFQGHKIHYEVRGNATKTLFFIHGWTGNIKAWKGQLDAFPQYKVIAIDLPGHGLSSKNEKAEYTMDLFADSVNEVLKKEGIKKAFFIGHSMGWAISKVIGIKYPDLCVGICSMDGANFEYNDDPKEYEKFKKSIDDFVKLLEQGEKGRDVFLSMLFLPNSPKMLKDDILKASKEVPLSIGISMIKGVGKDHKYWIKKTSNIPCLAIYAHVFPLPPNFKDEFKKSFPKVDFYEMDDVSHFLMMEVPYKINQIISDYLEKNYK